MILPTPEKLAEHNIHLFNELYQITNDQGEPLDFKDHPYLWDIFNDWSPKLCIKKSAQVGLSTTLVIKALWACKNIGLDIIYSFPTYDMAHKLVSGKVNRLIANNPVFQEWTKDKDSIEQKIVGKHTLYFQGTQNPQDAVAIPADLYVADEVDLSNQKVVELFSSRLQHSKYGWEWRFSNPSVPENGVDVWWARSDQKEWFVKCLACNMEQIMTMEHIKGIPAIFACEKCGVELDRRKGRWIARWDDPGLISGYHVSSLMANHISAQRALEEQRDKPAQQFANMFMGEPYVGRGNYLPRSTIYAAISKEENPQEMAPVIGVDTGKEIHMVVGNQHGIYYYEECKDYAPLLRLLDQYPKAIAVIDQGGDIQMPRMIRERYPGRVFLCAFTQMQGDNIIRWKDDEGLVNTDRNKAIQLVVDEITSKSIPFSGSREDYVMYADHWSHLYRVVEEDERGRRRYVWQRNGPDHLALATIYWRLGMDRMLWGSGEIIMPSTGLTSRPGMDLDGRLTRSQPFRKL